MSKITEAKVREIHKTTDLMQYTHDELREADLWIKEYATGQFALRVSAIESKPLRDYIKLMVRCNYGSVETDELLTQLNCYPDWMKS